MKLNSSNPLIFIDGTKLNKETAESIEKSMKGRSYLSRTLKIGGMSVSLVQHDKKKLHLCWDAVRIGKGIFLLGEQLGAGAFGKVRTALHIHENKLYAIKSQKVSRPHDTAVQLQVHLTKNFGISGEVYGPTYFYEGSSAQNEIVMCYVAMPLADVALHRYLSPSMSSQDVDKILRQVLVGLKRLHDKGYVHMDIKSDNILVKDGNAYVADFGVSVKVGSVRPLSSQPSSKYVHCGPEMFVDGAVGPTFVAQPSFDVWSFGHLVRTCNKFVYSSHREEIASMCMKRDPSQRPSIETLVSSLSVKT